MDLSPLISLTASLIREKMIASGAKRILPTHGAPLPVNKSVKNMRNNKSKELVHDLKIRVG